MVGDEFDPLEAELAPPRPTIERIVLDTLSSVIRAVNLE